MKKIFVILVALFQLVTTSSQAETVVGIHGFLGTWRTMKPIKHCLESYGYSVCLWEYPSRRRCFEEHAQSLVCLLQNIARANPGEPIHFAAHSSGAFILRSALNDPRCPEEAKIGKAVLFAPPNQGSSLGRRFRNMTPVQFAMGNRSGSELLYYTPCEVLKFGEFPPSMKVLVLAGTCGNSLLFDSPNDGFVRVEETYLNTPFYLQSFPANHGEILKYGPALCCMRTFICNDNTEGFQKVEETCSNETENEPEEEEIAIQEPPGSCITEILEGLSLVEEETSISTLQDTDSAIIR